MNDFEKNMYQEIRMLREKFSILKLENAKLREQLRWRPVSEKPEKEGIYLIRRVDLDAELMLYRGGKWWFFDDELFQYLEFDFDIMANKFKPTHWLPIPPAPEVNHDRVDETV
jgi:hypothetical protein